MRIFIPAMLCETQDATTAHKFIYLWHNLTEKKIVVYGILVNLSFLGPITAVVVARAWRQG